MRWRATVVVRLTFTEPRPAKVLEHELRQSLAVRTQGAKIRHVDPPSTSQFAYLRVDGRTRTLQGASRVVASLGRGLKADVGATTADIVHWDASRRGPLPFRRRTAARSVSGGDPGTGDPGTAGVREPRRPYPPGFPPMQASLDPPVR
jgi:hypothetical protein